MSSVQPAKVSIPQFITTTENNQNCRLCLKTRFFKPQVLTIVPNSAFEDWKAKALKIIGMGPLRGIIEAPEDVLTFIYSKLNIPDLSRIDHFCIILDQPIHFRRLVESVDDIALTAFFRNGMSLHSGKS